jgi:hypothetical protein
MDFAPITAIMAACLNLPETDGALRGSLPWQGLARPSSVEGRFKGFDTSLVGLRLK